MHPDSQKGAQGMSHLELMNILLGIRHYRRFLMRKQWTRAIFHCKRDINILRQEFLRQAKTVPLNILCHASTVGLRDDDPLASE
jgi:hypothetical protein